MYRSVRPLQSHCCLVDPYQVLLNKTKLEKKKAKAVSGNLVTTIKDMKKGYQQQNNTFQNMWRKKLVRKHRCKHFEE